MSRTFHRPVRRPGEVLDQFADGGDPAQLKEILHDTAAALLHQVRASNDPETVERVVTFADKYGIDELAQLWADAPAVSLPGALWRLYLVQAKVKADPQAAKYCFEKGLESEARAGRTVIGAGSPETDCITELITSILRGAFTGDFALALDRAAVFARVMSVGSMQLVSGETDVQRTERMHRSQEHWSDLVAELTACAMQWRAGNLY